MATLPDEHLRRLLAPYLAAPLTADQVSRLSAFLDLLMIWNARTNLTSVRDPEELVQRQIGESLFAARLIAPSSTLLDFGSGGGFPGIPLQIVLPELQVTLAESQGKKAAFLREAVRTLALPAAVWSRRVEEMPLERRFDVVVMRAVDKTEAMLPIAAGRVADGGKLVRFLAGDLRSEADLIERLPVPKSTGWIGVFNVPRETSL